MAKPIPIEGSDFSDNRGKIKFFNTFDMSNIVRFYEILPASPEIIRGWQGHHKEKKWFYCASGAFVVNLVGIKDITPTNKAAIPQRFELKANNPIILEVPSGYASGFKSMEEHSKLMIFSNFSLEESKNDDIRFPLKQWEAKW